MQSAGSFAHTRWSIVLHGTTGQTAGAEDPLLTLARAYSFPIYACFRRCGHAPAIAIDLCRLFLRELAQPAATRPAQGQSLRAYLWSRLNRLLGQDWRGKLAAGDGDHWTPPSDLEPRYQAEVAQLASPEQAYQRAFAVELLAHALQRLHTEAAQTGHLPMYQALCEFIARDPAPGVLENIGQRLHMQPIALVVALKRLRQRLREIAGGELADTVADTQDLAREQTILYAALRDRP
ncbi:MAG: hypothetical protein JSS03_08055 [Proteobacteria bacterium]|nr:hypothetical protein [Pseudomonadota bacterium]